MPDAPRSTPADRLGPLLSEHRVRPALRRTYVWSAAASFGGALIAWVIGVARGYFAYTTFGPAVVWRWATPSLAVGACLTGVSLIVLLMAWAGQGLLVCAFEGGLTYQRSRRGMMIPWSSIRAIRTSAVRYGLPGLAHGTRTDLHLLLVRARANKAGGVAPASRLHLPPALTDIDALAETIKRHVYPGLLAENMQDLANAKPLVFGPLVLSAEGLSYKKQNMAWQELSGAALQDGLLRLESASGNARGLRLAAGQIPNVEIFLQIIQHRLRKP